MNRWTRKDYKKNENCLCSVYRVAEVFLSVMHLQTGNLRERWREKTQRSVLTTVIFTFWIVSRPTMRILILNGEEFNQQAHPAIMFSRRAKKEQFLLWQCILYRSTSA